MIIFGKHNNEHSTVGKKLLKIIKRQIHKPSNVYFKYALELKVQEQIFISYKKSPFMLSKQVRSYIYMPTNFSMSN